MIGGSLLLLCGGITICCANPKRSALMDYTRTPSYAISASEETGLKNAIAPGMRAHPGQSGFQLLMTGDDSLFRRLAMIHAAERSLDIQYYMIETDMTGKLVLESILRAANRGVRVRILMDDLNRKKSDPIWSLFNAHRHIEIRVFNPFTTRSNPFFTTVKEIATGHFSRRMHNKVLIADNQAAIMGGRNLGDSYFDASADFNFRDVDVLAVGPIVVKLSRSFDTFWNDDEAFPINALLEPHDRPEAVGKLHDELEENWSEEVQKGTLISQIPFAAQIEQKKIPLVWAPAELAADSPSKIDTPKEEAVSKPGFHLDRMVEGARKEFLFVSPYFVPGKEGTEGLVDLVRRGIKVKVLTNSLASNDVVAVHTGYRRYRQKLVEGGVEVYEAKPVPGTRPKSRRFSSSSRNSLHSKIYVVDRRDIMVGSFNLDPRSLTLNTEMMLVIHSPELAEKVAVMFEKAISPSSSFHVVMHDKELEWVATEKGEEVRYDSEPKAGFWRNVKSHLFALLPFEDQL